MTDNKLFKMTINLTAIGFFFALCGCEPEWRHDQCLRREIFEACLQRIPKGPESTVYNDWAEVVEACEDAASSQSYRTSSQIPVGCK